MNSWKIILAVVVVFGAGVLTGGLLVYHVNPTHPQDFHFPSAETNPRQQMGGRDQLRPGAMPRLRSPEMWKKDFVGRLDKTLKLTPAQHNAIQKIFTEGQEQNWQIWTNFAEPKVRQVMDRVHQRIRAELTPDQQKKFEALTKRFAPHHPPPDESPPGPPPSTNPPPPAPDF